MGIIGEEQGKSRVAVRVPGGGHTQVPLSHLGREAV